MSDLKENQNPKVLKAREFVRDSQWCELLSYSNRWVIEEPKSWFAHYFTGMAASTLGLHDLAISAFISALGINRFEQRIWENLATAFEEKGDLKRSIETLREGIHSCQHQEDVKLLLAAGNFMGRTGDDNEALVYFKQAFDKKAKCLKAFEGMLTALRKLDRIPDLLDLISNNIVEFPHLAPVYNRLTQQPYIDSSKKWVLQNLFLACSACDFRFARTEVAGIKTYFRYENLLIEPIRGTAYCPNCKELTTGAQKPKPICLEQQKENLNQLMRRLEFTRKHINQSSFLALFFKHRKVNEESLKLENRIATETALLYSTDSIRSCNDYVHCEACGSLNAYFIQNIDLIKSSRTLTNLNCPNCKSLVELIGHWGPYRNIRFQPPLRDEEDDETKKLYWVIGDTGISRQHIADPLIILSDDPVFETRREIYLEMIDSINFEAAQLL